MRTRMQHTRIDEQMEADNAAAGVELGSYRSSDLALL